jgi:hypothetical protein
MDHSLSSISFKDINEPLIVVYSELDLSSNSKAQSKLLSGSEFQSLLTPKKFTRAYSIKSFNRLPSLHETPRNSLKQIEQKTITKWIGIKSNEILPNQAHAYAIPPFCSPLSFACGFIKPKDKLFSPLYLSPDFIEKHFNDSKYYDVSELYSKGFQANSKKELVLVDTRVIEIQKAVLGDVFKQFTKALFTGKEISSISLPITIMEPSSQVSAYSRIFSNLEQLYLASTNDSPLETFKHVITFACSGLYYSMNYFKPMNPYIGETMQGFFADGSHFYAEKISHNPQVCAYLIKNERFDFSLHCNIESHFEMTSNEIKNYFKGIFCVVIKGKKIYYSLPNMWARGIMFGKNTTGFENYFFFHYPECNLKAFIKIGNSQRADAFEGAISESAEALCLDSNKFGSRLFSGSKPKLSTIEKIISRINGGFTETLNFDETEFWNSAHKTYKVLMCDDVLPSDWRFREDLLWLSYGNITQAQNWKLKLEGIQRDWRKQRENYLKHKIIKPKK